jgi:hypothetical protein
MRRKILIKSALIAFVVAASAWSTMFISSGLPGHFNENNLVQGKGPDAGPESYACIQSGGALKLYRAPCDSIEYISDRIRWVIPYFFLSLLFTKSESVIGVSIFLVSFILIWFYLAKLRTVKS